MFRSVVIALLCVACALSSKSFGEPPAVTVETSWVGNTLPGAGDKVFPSQITSICVSPDGVVTTNGRYCETHCQMMNWQSGKAMTKALYMQGEGWMGGMGVARSTFLLMGVQTFEKKGNRDPNDPPNGVGISFRDPNSLLPIPIPDGKGAGGRSQLRSFLPIASTENTKELTFGIQGLAVKVHRTTSSAEQFTLYVSDAIAGKIHLYGIEAQRLPKSKVNFQTFKGQISVIGGHSRRGDS